ncbi:MAG: hypothetical protein DRM99_05740 [Thermoplasmata archaeon]|nr:MAG: hypothetical protein DRM99_05740 [Thermoplasmata archaeon]
MRVYIKFPWRFVDSPYYNTLINYPPKGVEFLGIAKERIKITSSKDKFIFLSNLKKFIRRNLEKTSAGIPNIHTAFTKRNLDLIHCAHCLVLTNRPWVVDLEATWQLWIGKPNRFSFNIVRKILLGKYMKKIMPWTNITKEEILKYFPNVREKVEVVYPAVPLPKIKRKRRKKLTILYVSRYFWIKGGLIALEVLERLKEKYDIREVFISDVPKNIKEKYKNLNIIELVPHRKLIETYFPQSDIFFYPSFVDTFGFALLEAMSFGLPIVTVNTKFTKSRKEIITNQNGFIIDIPYSINYYKIRKKEEVLIRKIVDRISLLIENSSLRKKMGKYGRKLIEKGKFSIRERNKKLKRIYEEALRK